MLSLLSLLIKSILEFLSSISGGPSSGSSQSTENDFDIL